MFGNNGSSSSAPRTRYFWEPFVNIWVKLLVRFDKRVQSAFFNDDLHTCVIYYQASTFKMFRSFGSRIFGNTNSGIRNRNLDTLCQMSKVYWDFFYFFYEFIDLISRFCGRANRESIVDFLSDECIFDILFIDPWNIYLNIFIIMHFTYCRAATVNSTKTFLALLGHWPL